MSQLKGLKGSVSVLLPYHLGVFLEDLGTSSLSVLTEEGSTLFSWSPWEAGCRTLVGTWLQVTNLLPIMRICEI